MSSFNQHTFESLAAYISSFFYFIAEVFCYMNLQQFVFPIEGHPDSFQFFNIMNKDAMNFILQVFCEYIFSCILGK